MNVSQCEFLKLGERVKLRILTEPHLYHCHPSFLMNGDGKLYGQKLKCPTFFRHDGDETELCELCKSSKSHPRWIIGVINRQDNNFYLIDIGYALFSQIKNIATDSSWGDPQNYDIEIVKSDNVHNVNACPKSPLTAQEELLKSNIDRDYLLNLCDPMEPPHLIEIVKNYARVNNDDKSNSEVS